MGEHLPGRDVSHRFEVEDAPAPPDECSESVCDADPFSVTIGRGGQLLSVLPSNWTPASDCLPHDVECARPMVHFGSTAK